MTTDVFEAEFARGLATATKRGVGIKVEEPARRRGYGMGNFVFAPAAAIGFMVYFGVFGALLTMLSAIHMYLGSTNDRAWLIVFGLPWVFASRAAYVRFNAQLDEYNDLQWRTKEVHVDPPKVLQTERQIEQTEPGRHVVLQAKWIGNWKRDLANRVHNNRGEWIGGDKVTRKILKDIVRDLNNKYSTVIKADLLRLGWIAENLEWTGKGKDDLRAKVFNPPPQGAGP